MCFSMPLEFREKTICGFKVIIYLFELLYGYTKGYNVYHQKSLGGVSIDGKRVFIKFMLFDMVI